MRPRNHHRRPGLILAGWLAVWLALSLACNYPGLTRQPAGMSGDDLRATLAAQPTPGVEETSEPPVPGSTPFETPQAGQPATQPTSPAFWGLTTATPGQEPASAPSGQAGDIFTYTVQPGDTLLALAGRFSVEPAEIHSAQPLPEAGYLTPGVVLEIPNRSGNYADPSALLPDGEVVYGPSAAGFDPAEVIQSAGGYLASYEEVIEGEALAGSEIVRRVSVELSVNPRLLLALLEYRSGWLTGEPSGGDPAHPLGLYVPGNSGLYRELQIAATQLNVGYYGWRMGTLDRLKYQDGSTVRPAPMLNAGTAALQHLFARLYKPGPWREALYGPESFPARYAELFGDPWARAAGAGALIPPGLAQPPLELPFPAGERWSFTGGPHISWNAGTPPGALDFSPVTNVAPCAPSPAWVTASASGLVTRAEDNVVAIDLDGDGSEGTGWVLIYMHVAEREIIQAGVQVSLDQPIGHPSCERGRSTGTHVHLARKFNGEWLEAAGPLPFNLSGWEARPGARSYEGELVKGDQVVSANPGGPRTSIIVR